MNFDKRLEAVEAALARQTGDGCVKVIFIDQGETHDEALRRAGLSDWKGQTVFVNFVDAAL